MIHRRRLVPQVVPPAAIFAVSLAAMLCASLARGGEEAPAGSARKPNIVVILADDLGWGELGCYGGKEIPTPHLDALARGGVRFTSGYVSCPVCSPTRAGLLTGRYQVRFGHEFNPGPLRATAKAFGLPLSETTMADRLKAAGYRTGLVGKWHLGTGPYHPLKRGFDEYFGFLGGAHPYMAGENRQPAKAAKAGQAAKARKAAQPAGMADIFRGMESAGETEYLTDAFTREAVAFIGRHKSEPFFLYLAYNAVHAPLQAPPKYMDRFTKITDPKRRTFAAMLSCLDDGVGAVLKALADAGIERDTLVVFLSDNGGPTPSTTSGNGPLRGTKATTYEGGIRVPFLMRWPGKIPAGAARDEPVIALDILPTALAAAGVTLSPSAKLDGADLLPFLAGPATKAPHEILFWRYGDLAAVRKGPWKLVRGPAGPWQLFDLSADIGESKDLSAAKKDVFEELSKAFKSWSAGLAEPLWGPAARARAGKK